LQCFTHRYLGWKINVVDSCDKTLADASAESSEDLIDRTGEDDDEPDEAASIIFETRVKVPAGEKILEEEFEITDAQPSPSAPADLVPPSAAQASYVNDLTSRNGEASPDAESKEHPQFESPKVTETFEPMFVPSPIDRNIKETPRLNAFRPPPTKGKHFLRRPPPRHRVPHPVQKRAPFYRRTHHHQY
jgi:hypothetical protein